MDRTKHRTGGRRAKRGLKIKHKAVASLEAELLRRVRACEGLSRFDLSRKLQLAPSTVGAYVDRLIAEGFLLEWQKPERESGRPPTLLALNPKGGRFIGVDFEAHNIMATAVDFSQRPLKQVHRIINPSDSVARILSKIERSIEQVMGDNGEPLLGIGVGVPGTIDTSRQIAVHYEYISGWDNIPLGKRLREKFGVEVHLENNIRSMALAELWFGQGRALRHFICLGIRTGISAGVIADGRLLYGEDNLAGEIGHWLCPTAPFETGHGKKGGSNVWKCQALRPLEQVASIPAILDAISRRRARGQKSRLKLAPGPIEFADVITAAKAGDQAVTQVLEDVAQTVAWVVCQMNALFSPAKIILGGPLTDLGELFLQPLTQATKEICAEFGHAAPAVVDSQLGSFNGALGAAALALHEWKPAR